MLAPPGGPAYACPPLSAGPIRAAPTPPLPLSRQEMELRGWEQVDVVFVTGDAYVDHPSFAMALSGATLRERGLSRWNRQSTGLAFLPSVANFRPAAAVHAITPATWTR